MLYQIYGVHQNQLMEHFMAQKQAKIKQFDSK
jgi:hypothetical protein